MKTHFWSLSILFLGFAAQAAAAETKVEFRVRELWREVTGHFEKAEVQFSPQIGTPASLVAKIDARTINTGIDARDAHLRAADFFDAQKFPSISFHSTEVIKRVDGSFLIKGALTLRGTTKAVMFRGTCESDLCQAAAAIDRRDFGLTWNQPLKRAGEFLVGNRVDILVTTRFKTNVELSQK